MSPRHSFNFEDAPQMDLGNRMEVAKSTDSFGRVDDSLYPVLQEILQSIWVDRVLLYRLLPNGDGLVAEEAVHPDWPAIQGQLICDPCLQSTWIDRYQQGQVTCIEDIETHPIAPCYKQLLTQVQVRANLVVPILLPTSEHLWGLLIVHQCRSSRQWQLQDIEYLQHIAAYLGFALERQTRHPAPARFQPQNVCRLPEPERPIGLTIAEWKVFDRLQTPIWIFDVANWRMEWANLAAVKLWNAESRHELLNRSFSDFSESTRIRLQSYQQQFQQGLTTTEQWTFYPKGNPVSARCLCSGIQLADGRSAMLVEATIDPSGPIDSQTLRSIEALRHTSVMVSLYTLSGVPLMQNPAALRCYGDTLRSPFTQSQLNQPQLDQNVLMQHFVDPEVGQQAMQAIAAGEVYSVEAQVFTLQGICWHGIDIRLTIDPVTGQPMILVNEKDISRRQTAQHDRRQAEAALRESEERYRSVIAALSEGIVLQQANGQITACNASAEKILGLTIDQMMGRTSLHPNWSTVHEDGSPFPGETHPAMLTLKTGQPLFNVVMGVHKPDRSLTWILINSQPLFRPNQPHPYAVVASFVDITDRKQSETALKILHGHVKQLNTQLELQVQERTSQLQQALDIEASLKRITDKVRDSLDEDQILQTAVQELRAVLQVDTCDVGIYNADRTLSTVQYESTQQLFTSLGQDCSIANSSAPEIYAQLFRGEWVQFCLLGKNLMKPEQPRKAVLACPIFDGHQALGDLWLFKPCEEPFGEMEVRLVQQVANQCAIALRQSRLYHASQAQVQELERLNQLKDDFLSTVSHELRTPVSSIKMATQMLETLLHPLGVLEQESNSIHRYLHVVQTECEREIRLINDLLNLTRLDSGTEPLNLHPVDLRFWLPHVAETFSDRCQEQHQQLQVCLSPELLPLTTDLTYLERVLVELLHNACKYTPPGQTIRVSAQCIPAQVEPGSNQVIEQVTEQVTEPATTKSAKLDRPALLISVSNTGVEIPTTELDRVFDKFYRIPNHDPWKHGGTGLGLALVKKLVEYLGGTIDATSHSQQTTFTLRFPLG